MEPYVQGGKVKLLQSKRRAILIFAIILAVLFMVRPGANRLKSRVVNSMSVALGRQTEVSAVTFHLLPRPGFDLENLVVHDDPTISAEPMLRASEVSAALRLTSLLRGRLEISRLDLTEPSLNLARTVDGRWNLEGLVERAAKEPVAPTSKTVTEKRPGFPYIQANRARINIKLGQEKKAFALTDTDFALWQESENTWGVRLRAQPVRTDFNLTDTGLLRINGTWRRASSLRETPLDFSVSWQGAQLGALTKLAFARDRGWRGVVDVSFQLKGKPSDLAVIAEGAIQDFRRYDILSTGSTRLATQCSAHFDSSARQFQDLDCESSVGEGKLRLTGVVTDPLGERTYNLKLTADRLPAQELVNLARRAKKDLPEGLVAAGTVQATLTARKADGAAVVYGGGGETTPVTLGDSRSDAEAFDFGKITFIAGGIKEQDRSKHKSYMSSSDSAELELNLLPFPISLGRPAPAIATATLLRYRYGFSIQGEAQIQRVIELARLLGLPGAQPAADGVAKVDMRLAGSWSGFAAPRAEGTAQLRAIRAEVPGTSAPIDIVSGQLTLTPQEATFDKLTATGAGGHWSGKIIVPRLCEGDSPCFARFDMQVDTLSTEEIGKFLTPSPGKRPWYRMLSRTASSSPSPFASLRAEGTLHVGRLAVHRLIASKVTTTLELDKGKLRLSHIRAQVLGGAYQGDWIANYTVKPPTYSGKGQFEKISLGQLSEALSGNWANGVGSGTFEVEASGGSMPALHESSSGVLEFDMRAGRFPNLALHEGGASIAVQRFTGTLVRNEGKFQMQEGKLQTDEGIYEVSGTVSAGNKLDLKLGRAGGGYVVTGTLAEPRVAPDKTPTQAALKP